MGELTFWIAGIMLIALTIYALGGGADFGGGVWDILARGPRKNAQRELIANAIGPIWEANHVWLILVVVLLFVAYPAAFAAISIALHIPLTILLIGIVLRGSAFTFRTYDQPGSSHRRWGRVFAIASVISPIMLGICVGAIASSRIHAHHAGAWVAKDFLSSWMAPFPWAIGGLTLSLFAFLAAVYLSVEAADDALKNDFRVRGLGAAIAVGVMAWLSFLLARNGAPGIRQGLASSFWAVPFQILTAAIALGAMTALWKKKFRLARALAIAQVTLVIWGWGLAQFPFAVPPDLTFYNAAAPVSVLRLLLIALAAGALVLFPSLAYLYAIFKGHLARRPE